MLETELTRRFHLDHPIVQAGMGSGAGWQLASAVSDAGALGTIGTIPLGPSQVLEAIEATRQATDATFAVNLVCFDWAPFAPDIVDAVIEARPPAVTLSFGDPSPALTRCHDAGIPVLVQVQDLDGLPRRTRGWCGRGHRAGERGRRAHRPPGNPQLRGPGARHGR